MFTIAAAIVDPYFISIKEKWIEISDDMELIAIHPYKKDILVDLFGVAWLPYHIVEAGGRRFELPGFGI